MRMRKKKNLETRIAACGDVLIPITYADKHFDAPIEQDFRCEIKVRYRNESCFATVRIAKDGSFEAILDAPRYGVAPGQSLVCYWRDRLLGGGRIIC